MPCLVIGCRRTAPAAKYPPNTVIVCGKCWRLAPKNLRARCRRIERLMRKAGIIDWSFSQTAPGSIERRLFVLHSIAFERVVKAATEARVGIG